MTKKRKVPERMCLGCKEKRPKRNLVRIVRSPEGEISLDFTGKKSGRGAYICYSFDCFETARKNKSIERSLGITLKPEVWDDLEKTLNNESRVTD